MQIHFIAIGGSAMHNLALALHEKGYQITGSDDAIYEPSKTRLNKKGLLPLSMGWFPDKITTDLDAIILGMHAQKDNPELLKAKELGIKIYSYPEFLYHQSKDKTRVVIGGSHGKTTITSMILHVLNFHNKPTDYMVGAQLEGFDTMVKLTKENDFVVLEGDEYLSSPIDRRSKFLLYLPNIALVSGIAWDHINVFPTFEDYTLQFQRFVDSISDGGALIYNKEDKEVVKVVEKSTKYLKKYPYQTPKHRIENGKSILETEFGDVPLVVFGSHNLLNLEGAKNICLLMGITEEEFYEAIVSFKVASKRLEFVKETPEYIIYKDFAHAPSKVIATTQAVKAQFQEKQLICCLELHTYSSLNPEFISQYQNSLNDADIAIVFISKEAMEIKRMQPLSTEQIQTAFDNTNIKVVSSKKELETLLHTTNKNNSVLLMMSSGSFEGMDLKEI